MADDSDIRAVLREHGVSVPARGKLSAAHRREYDRIRGVPDSSPDDDAGWDDDQQPGDTTGATAPPAGDGGPGVAGERRPRRPRSSSNGKGIGSLFNRNSGGRKRRRTRHDRVPVDRIIGRLWEFAARVTVPMSGPVSTTFRLQAPIAGLVLEDTFRDTFVDTVLQPVARMEERGEKVVALVGPPLLVAAIEAAQGMEEPARQMRLAVLQPMLEEALTLWVKIADDKVATARERIEADAEIRAAVRELLLTIFPPAEVVPDEEEQAGQEQQTAGQL